MHSLYNKKIETVQINIQLCLQYLIQFFFLGAITVNWKIEIWDLRKNEMLIHKKIEMFSKIGMQKQSWKPLCSQWCTEHSSVWPTNMQRELGKTSYSLPINSNQIENNSDTQK